MQSQRWTQWFTWKIQKGKIRVELEARRGLHYDGISKRIQGTWYTRLCQVPSHKAYTHTLQLNIEFSSTLSILSKEIRDSHSLTLSILSREISDKPSSFECLDTSPMLDTSPQQEAFLFIGLNEPSRYTAFLPTSMNAKELLGIH